MNEASSKTPRQAVVIGASCGAVDALSRILPCLPGNFPGSILVVVHLPPDHPSALVDILIPKCKVTIKEAEDKEVMEPATVYLAPPNYHLLVETDGSLSLSSDEPELFSRPSVNVLFESAADAFGSALTVVILSGANNDGAHGSQAACAVGATVLVQDPKTAEAPAMPQAALEACPRATVMSLKEIGAYLAKLPGPTQ